MRSLWVRLSLSMICWYASKLGNWSSRLTLSKIISGKCLSLFTRSKVKMIMSLGRFSSNLSRKWIGLWRSWLCRRSMVRFITYWKLLWLSFIPFSSLTMPSKQRKYRGSIIKCPPVWPRKEGLIMSLELTCGNFSTRKWKEETISWDRKSVV